MPTQYYEEKSLATDGCAGSPNEYDAQSNPLMHTVSDQGGIFNSFPFPSSVAIQGAAQSLINFFIVSPAY